jgi:integrase
MAATEEAEASKIRAGLIDPKALGFREQEQKPLVAHLADYHAYLIGKGATRNHANLTRNRVARLIELSRARRVSELVPSLVQAGLKAVWDKGVRRDAGLSLRSVHHYTRAVKGFSRWLWRDGRTREDALAHLTPPNPDPDRRRVRRALTPAEQVRLIRSADSGPPLFGMAGPDRARLYAVALGTGFRANELRTLVPACFDLTASPPTVTVKAAYSKHRRDDMQPIRPELAAALRPWLATKPDDAPVFGSLTMRTGEMIRADLERADLPYETSEGTADFHALRHSYVSTLAK